MNHQGELAAPTIYNGVMYVINLRHPNVIFVPQFGLANIYMPGNTTVTG